MAFSEVTEDIEIQAPPPGGALSLNADEDVIAGQVVKQTSDNGCEPSDTDGEQCVGVAAQTVSAGDQVMVLGPGARVRFSAGAAVSNGTQLASHGATGEEGEVADAATGDFVIGYPLESAADGDTFVGMVAIGGGEVA